jgi:hypothetical protein
MNEVIRKKSPRAPSIPLEEALDKALRVYEKEKRYPAPTEVVAQDMGYKSANNGAALSALASLRYFGLLEKPEDGKLAVSKDVENYQYAPDLKIKSELLLKWLRAPAIFADLLDRYPEGLPSDANLRFDLINRGFSPAAGDSAISVFRRSAEFAGYTPSSLPRNESNQGEPPAGEAIILENGTAPVGSRVVGGVSKSTLPSEFSVDDTDTIPVRLSEGRKAWLVIPTPFYEADKLRLKAQIDLLLTEDLE